VITKYAFATRVGYAPNNPNKVNQDSFILSPNINNCNYLHYFGVCDGHGQNGKEVSHYCKMKLPTGLAKELKHNSHDVEGAFKKTYLKVNSDLDDQTYDCSLSGTTVCTLLFQGTKIICANAGDSRAIKVGFTDPNGPLDVTALNRDHKPDLPDEMERIKARGGRIDAFRDHYNNNEPIGPARVWLKHEDLPGLAMSRSLGDKVAQSVGVSPEPDVLEFTLTIKDRFVVIASDGVWEFLPNEEVAQIVLPFYE